MSNSDLFSSAAHTRRGSVPRTNIKNDAGGRAYALSDEEALVQIALTGTFNGTFYTKAEKQLERLIAAADNCAPEFVARVACYARTHGLMKDTPVALTAYLMCKGESLLADMAASVTLNNGKQLRNFVKMMRSGVFGRKSLGTAARRIVREKLEAMTPEDLLWASVGNDGMPLASVIKLAHPNPKTPAVRAMHAWLLGEKEGKGARKKPMALVTFENFKEHPTEAMIPNLPLEAITPLLSSDASWIRYVNEGPLTFLAVLKNLRSFARHGVFNDVKAARRVADIISKGGKVMPYQIMTAVAMADDSVPMIIKDMLRKAMDAAVANVPDFGRVVVGVDTSGSMKDPITGDQGDARPNSVVTCRNVAALVAASFMAKSAWCRVLPFDTVVHGFRLGDSILSNVEALSRVGGGGTDCSAPLRAANEARDMPPIDLFVIVSDNESWKERSSTSRTDTMAEWVKFKARHPAAKLVCVDLTPNTSTQAPTSAERLNVGGFSDHVFDAIKQFVEGGTNLVDKIKESS